MKVVAAITIFYPNYIFNSSNIMISLINFTRQFMGNHMSFSGSHLDTVYSLFTWQLRKAQDSLYSIA